jgi:hypothetical protein
MSSEVASGLCHCGCNQRTALCTRTNLKSGEVEGEPRKYIRGHNQRGKHNPNGGRRKGAGHE